jgi:hypothetical protein
MKKLTLCIIAALMMVPFSAFAMDTMTDGELETITGQTGGGISISFMDVQADLDIMNLAWGDTDCGTLILSTLRHSYTAGYLNINNIQIDNVYLDAMDYDNWGIATDRAGGTYLEEPLHGMTIDVMTFSSNGPHCPSQFFRGKTAVVVGHTEGHIDVENITVDGIYLDDHAYTVQTAEFTSMQKFTYTTGPLDDSKNLGTLTISGVHLTGHAYVGGYEAYNAVPGGSLRPIHPNHRAFTVITTH